MSSEIYLLFAGRRNWRFLNRHRVGELLRLDHPVASRQLWTIAILELWMRNVLHPPAPAAQVAA